MHSDAVVQKRRAANENAALVSMVDRSDIHEPVIITADRGYESYNTLEHISRKGWKYLIRVRESRGITSALSLPEGDKGFRGIFGNLKSNHTKRERIQFGTALGKKLKIGVIRKKTVFFGMFFHESSHLFGLFSGQK